MDIQIEDLVKLGLSRRMYFYPPEAICSTNLLRDQLGFGAVSLARLVDTLRDMLFDHAVLVDDAALHAALAECHCVGDLIDAVDRAVRPVPVAQPGPVSGLHSLH